MLTAILRASSFVSSLAPARPARLIFKIDIGERLSAAVADNKAGFQFIDGLGQREAAI
jgi:hypothetical protein